MLKIREYVTSDHDVVWDIHNVALHAIGAHAGNGPWDDDLHDIERVYLRDRGAFLVGLVENRLVAMGALKRSGNDRAEIKRIRVHPAFQRRGFGQAILRALENRASELGYKQLHLDTTTKQEAAQHLYRRNGYQEVGRSVQYGYECVLFEKSL